VLDDVPHDFLRTDRGAAELVNAVAQLEGALGNPGDRPGQVSPLRPQPGGSDHVEHLFLGAVDDDLDLETHSAAPKAFRVGRRMCPDTAICVGVDTPTGMWGLKQP
jgi:hypothetical protein